MHRQPCRSLHLKSKQERNTLIRLSPEEHIAVLQKHLTAHHLDTLLGCMMAHTSRLKCLAPVPRPRHSGKVVSHSVMEKETVDLETVELEMVDLDLVLDLGLHGS